MSLSVAAIVLAGGGSTRMGSDKALLPYGGGALIQHVVNELSTRFEPVLISTNDAARYAFLGLRCVADRTPGQGPLMGLASALAASPQDLNFVVACDIPEPDLALAEELLGCIGEADCAVPVDDHGGYEPLHAVYRKTIVPHIESALAQGIRAVHRVFPRCRVRTVSIAAGRLQNLNTPEDYRRFERGGCVQ